MVRCYSQYDRPSLDECPFEVHEDEGKVERDGYIPTDKLVNQLIEAGNNLQAFREAQFAADEEVPDDVIGDRPMLPLDAMQASIGLADKVRNDLVQAKSNEAVSPPEEEVNGDS